jgi:hypothetical protein
VKPAFFLCRGISSFIVVRRHAYHELPPYAFGELAASLDAARALAQQVVQCFAFNDAVMCAGVDPESTILPPCALSIMSFHGLTFRFNCIFQCTGER